MTLPNTACWDAKSAHRILRTTALEGSPAIFMATHTPLAGSFTLDGKLANLVQEASEHGLLSVLNEGDLRFTLVIVEGEPGAGKSHLIRWLAVNWKRPDDLVLLVERADGSLEGTLNRLRASLPEKYQDLFVGLGQVHTTTIEGRARDFLAKLSNSSRIDTFEKKLPHADWLWKNEIHLILSHPKVVDAWRSPLRILEVLSGNGTDGRNSRVAGFTLADIARLGQLRPQVTEVGVAAMFHLRSLESQAREILTLVDKGMTDKEIEKALGGKIANSVQLRDALNSRLNYAVQSLLGISAQGLKTLFTRLREALKKENRRLILLLEDITNFQGVDDQLLDALSPPSDTQPDGALCDLVAVLGVTPDYYRKHLTPGNFLQRVTFRVRMGKEQSGSAYQAGLSLQAPASRQQFAAKYLRAVRAGQDRLERWYQETEGRLSPPNVCETCAFRTACHEAFGSVRLDAESSQSVGLFPLTAKAIDRLYSALEDPESYMTMQTPRGMIQGVLAPALWMPEAVKQGTYPPPFIETTYLPASQRTISNGMLSKTIANHVADPVRREQFRRLVAWWGNRNSPQTLRETDGHLSFAGVPQTVFATFGLPWIGEASDVPPAAAPVVEPDAPKTPAERSPSATATVAGPAPVKPPEPAPSVPAETRDQETAPLPQRELDRKRDHLSTWFNDGHLEAANDWHLLIVKSLDLLDWETLGISEFAREKLFSKNVISLEGAKDPDRRHFVLPREDWVVAGLEAMVTLDPDSQASVAELDYARRKFAAYLNRLAPRVQAHVAKLLPGGKGMPLFTPAGAIAQVLLVRAWLGGATTAATSLGAQWRAILEGTAELTENSPRSAEWEDWLDRTKNLEPTFRHMLERLTHGRLLAVHGVAPALRRLQDTMRLDPAPTADLVSSLSDLQKFLSQRHALPEAVETVINSEAKRLTDQLDHLLVWTRSRTLSEHFRRIFTLSDGLSSYAQYLTSAAFKDLRTLTADLRNCGYMESDHADLKDLERFRRSKDRKATDLAVRLSWAQQAPAAILDREHSTLARMETSLQEVFKNVEAFVKKHGQGPAGSVEALNDTGRDLERIGAQLSETLQERN